MQVLPSMKETKWLTSAATRANINWNISNLFHNLILNFVVLTESFCELCTITLHSSTCLYFCHLTTFFCSDLACNIIFSCDFYCVQVFAQLLMHHSISQCLSVQCQIYGFIDVSFYLLFQCIFQRMIYFLDPWRSFIRWNSLMGFR